MGASNRKFDPGCSVSSFVNLGSGLHGLPSEGTYILELGLLIRHTDIQHQEA